MKQEFQVLRSRPLMSFILTRDSVCAGYDVDAPHKKLVEIDSFLDPVALALELAKGYLASVNGVGHSWECMLNGKRIAVVLPNGTATQSANFEYQESNSVHFKYNSATF